MMPMLQSDAAVQFTLRYLALLETHLLITWTSDDRPVCVVDWIGDDAIAALKAALADLLGSPLHTDARQATIAYGAEHIQTVGFGLAPDFTEFIKLGLIYGERVVLWDIVASRYLAKPQFEVASKSVLAQSACELLMLRSVVERGGVVVLGHPITWSPLAAEIDGELHGEQNVSAATLGLSIALAAIEEGLPLHPYALLRDGYRPATAQRVESQTDELFSAQNYVFQQSIGSLLRDQRVGYLRDVRVVDFFDVLSEHSSLRRALRRHFSLTLEGMSPQQAKVESEALTEDLVRLIEKQNAAITDYVAEGVDATGTFLLASIAAISVGMPLVQMLSAVGAVALPLTTAVRKWANRPPRNIIVQSFKTLADDAENSMPCVPSLLEPSSEAVKGVVEPSIQDLHNRFMAFHWASDRHHLLESLSPEVARALLATLGPNDLWTIVNERHRQEAYIGDYLAHLWKVDEASYWEHLGKSCESPDGLLAYDLEEHVDNMRSCTIPIKVWSQVLDSLFVAHAEALDVRNYDYALERLLEIIVFQCERADDAAEKRAALVSQAAGLDPARSAALADFLKTAFGGQLPAWIVI
ncbi:hypothetical protein PMI14_06781 [Acidovorax sp. CF316]|nr:hypothetical protein PMI14_06781 [Acidovorax sp. CF316]